MFFYILKKYSVLLKFRKIMYFKSWVFKHFWKICKHLGFETSRDLGNPTTRSPHFTGSPPRFPDQQHQHLLGTCREGTFSGPSPDPLNQKFCGWGPSNLCFKNPSPLLTGVARWVRHCPTNGKVVCWIPVRAQARVAGLGTDSGCARGRQLMFLCTFAFLSLFFSTL